MLASSNINISQISQKHTHTHNKSQNPPHPPLTPIHLRGEYGTQIDRTKHGAIWIQLGALGNGPLGPLDIDNI